MSEDNKKDKMVESPEKTKRERITDRQEKAKKIERGVMAQFEQLDLLISSINDLHESIIELNESFGALFKIGANSSEINFDRMPEPKRGWLDTHIFKRKEETRDAF